MTAQFKRGDRFVYRHIAGEHLLVALQRETVSPLFTFTPTAAALWQKLDDWRSAEMLSEFLVERYDVTRDDAARDVADFLGQLTSLRAVEMREVMP